MLSIVIHISTCRYLLHKDKKREDQKAQAGNLTPTAQQLGKNIRNSRMAKLAVSAMTTAVKQTKEPTVSSAEDNQQEIQKRKKNAKLEGSEKKHKGSECSTKSSILSRLLRSNKVLPSPKESMCSVDVQSDHSSSVVEQFRHALELHQEQLNNLDSTMTRPRSVSFDESDDTPSVVNSSLSGADRWKMASEALSTGKITLSQLAQRPILDSTISCDSPTKNIQSLWPRARDVVSTGSGVSSLYADDMSQLSSGYEDLEDESLL